MRNIKIYLMLLILILSSCNQKNKNQIRIGVSQCSDDSWRRTMNEEIIREASFYENVEINILTAYDNNQKQIRDIQNLIEDKIDLLIVSPNSAVPLMSVVEEAMNAGIPVLMVDRKINSDKFTAFVGANNFQIGKEVANYMASLLNGKGNVLEIRGLNGSTPDNERHNGFISTITQYPGIKLVKQIYGNWNRAVAKKKMAEFLNSDIDVDLVFAQNDEMANGVYEAYKEKGKLNKRPYIIGIDAQPGINGGIQQVIDGKLDATFFYPTGGDVVVQTAMKILTGEPFDKVNVLYTAVVDNTNARIIKLQTDQIQNHQNRINNLNTSINKSIAQYSTQKSISLMAIITMVIFLFLTILLYLSYQNKKRINKQLELTNQKIKHQKDEISEQRDQLVALSKNLEDATQAKLTFFTNISHEFRTPLTLLAGPLDTVLKQESVSPDGSRLLNLMKKQVLVLMKLIDQIIEFRKFENGKMNMSFTLSDLRGFLSEIIDSFQEIARKKHQKLNFEFENNEFLVWYDTDKMEKILNNLIYNALKFTPERGVIKVRLSKFMLDDQQMASITVSDNGAGIEADKLKKIFDRFYIADERSSGSGIGLALTKALVEQHNGKITVTSTPGSGTEFNVLIPVKQKNIIADDVYPVLNSRNFNHDELAELSQTNPEQMDDNADLDESTKKALILLVEDNPDVRSYFRILFKDLYVLTEAVNGQEGLMLAIKTMPDIIISDVIMDGMDGFELCASIKENISTSHIPVILLTALNMDEQRAKGFESGADAYIPKPFNAELLIIRVRKILENREKLKGHFQENLTFGDRKEKLNNIDKSFIEKFREYIEENIVETELNVDDIGKSFGLSRVQLYRKIKALTNYSPNELVRNIRLKTAQDMLLHTDKTISEIAYDTGFSSPSYFTRCYREYYNESPSDYARKFKNSGNAETYSSEH